jgi:DNA repair exonuclease SbcCD nuclease subunit
MARPLFVNASDNHLAPRAWAGHPSLAGDSYYSLEQLVDYCVAHELPLLLAGDVIDTAYPDPTTMHHLVEQLGRMPCEDNWFIQGQHELQRTTPWLSLAALLGDNLRHAHRRMFRPSPLSDFTVYGLDWQPTAQLRDELLGIPDTADASGVNIGA